MDITKNLEITANINDLKNVYTGYDTKYIFIIIIIFILLFINLLINNINMLYAINCLLFILIVDPYQSVLYGTLLTILINDKLHTKYFIIFSIIIIVLLIFITDDFVFLYISFTLPFIFNLILYHDYIQKNRLEYIMENIFRQYIL